MARSKIGLSRLIFIVLSAGIFLGINITWSKGRTGLASGIPVEFVEERGWPAIAHQYSVRTGIPPTEWRSESRSDFWRDFSASGVYPYEVHETWREGGCVTNFLILLIFIGLCLCTRQISFVKDMECRNDASALIGYHKLPLHPFTLIFTTLLLMSVFEIFHSDHPISDKFRYATIYLFLVAVLVAAFEATVRWASVRINAFRPRISLLGAVSMMLALSAMLPFVMEFMQIQRGWKAKLQVMTLCAPVMLAMLLAVNGLCILYLRKKSNHNEQHKQAANQSGKDD